MTTRSLVATVSSVPSAKHQMRSRDARSRRSVGRPDLGDELIVSGLVGDEPEILDAGGPDRAVRHRELDERRIARTLLRAGRAGFMRGEQQRESQQ